MLRFILGKSGTGKTTCIYNRIKELVKGGNDKIIMLVPDMSTFETEKELLELLGAKNSKSVKVFGFARLCRYVFEQISGVPKNVIDSGTRAVIMNITIEQLTEKLRLLKTKNIKSIADIMLQTLSDCKKSGVTTDRLYRASEDIEDDSLSRKLYETALVLDTFDAIVSQSYIDPIDDLTRLFNILSENNIFDDYTFFIDSFSGFSAQQLKVLRLIMSQSRETCVALTLDPESDGREEVFATSHATYKALKSLAKRDSIEIKSPVKLTESKKFVSSELVALEKSIFRIDAESENKNPEDIILYSASDRYEECEFVARQIKKMIIKENRSYSDFSVICHDTEPYKGIINTVFKKYEIPSFMDSVSDIEVKPVVRFINSIFRIILDNFEREDVVSLLKTGLTENCEQDISEFENYIFVWNINNNGFKSEFKQNPKGFSSNLDRIAAERLAAAERVRKSVVEPLSAFKESIKDKTGREITELLYNLLTEMKVQEAVGKLYDSFEKAGEKPLGAEQIRVWNYIMDSFDKTVAVIGDTFVSPKRYYELLSIQISAIELLQFPQTLDSVTVTTAQRVRLSKQKISFLIGCVDGEFPAVPHCSGVFSSFELKLLSLNDVKLSEDFSDLANLETFMAYCCMTSPSEKLYISYPTADLLGSPYNPSVIFEEVHRAFPNAVMTDKADYNRKKDVMCAVQPAFEEYSRSLAQNIRGLKGLEEFFANDTHYCAKSKAVKRSTDRSPFRIEYPENAERLFGNDLRLSASQIEKFSLCKFAYFCNYGLNVRELRRAEINPMEYGTLVHFILERFFTEFGKNEYASMGDEQLKSFINSILSDYSEEYFGGAESLSKAFLYRLKTLSDNVFILLKHIVDELSQSDFCVSDCELKIGKDIPAYTVNLPDGHKIAVCGSVDRVDVMENDGEKYIRIIDYKTGTKQFKLSDILYGLNLQMLLYLYSINLNGNEKYGEAVPSGILYRPATVPIVSADKRLSDEEISSSIDSALKMNGLILDDVTVVKGMDKSGTGKYIPVKIKLDSPVSTRSLASLEQFGQIFKKLDSIVISMGKELYGGKIEASPTKGAHDACEYCPYDSVCAYRISDSRNTFDVANDEVFASIEKELEKGDE